MRVRAFTLIEVLVSLVVISIAFVAVLRGSVFNLRSLRSASDLTLATIAAETMIKETLVGGYPESGTEDGVFEEGPFQGLEWSRQVEVMELPYIEDLKLVTVEVGWGRDRTYTLSTVVSRK
jgi:type II secretion system protein I